LRTLVLAAGVLLVVALAVFLAIGKWKHPFNRKDLPQRLGLNIQQEANGWTYTHGLRGHTQYKIHASRLEQLKQGNRVLLHDVKIELYGEDGSRVDRIQGSEFEWDPDGGTAKANGPVEITLMRPGVAPAIAPKATPGQAVADKPKSALTSAAKTASTGEIHVKTSGLTFDKDSGLASTTQRVDFSMAQGTGNSMGASYDSDEGLLVLDHAVELTTRRAGELVELHAQHAEFERDSQLCRMRTATADYRGGEATAAEARVLFREDGSAVRLDAAGGFTLTTANGGKLAAPIGRMDFTEKNLPRHGHLEGGVTMESARAGRHVHGTAPAVELEFNAQGILRHAHMERGVQMRTEEQSESQGEPLRVSRDWRSPVADIEFRENAKGQAEPATIHGIQGVVVTGESQRGKGAVQPSRLAADDLTGQFGPGSVLTAITGIGHAAMEQTTATGTREQTSGDRIEAHLAPAAGGKPAAKGAIGAASQIQAATVEGHVVLVEEPAAKPGQQQTAMRATAGKAVYEGAGEWLHLTVSPRVEDGGLQLTADKIDVSQASGDAFAHGNVKASWVSTGDAAKGPQQGTVALGGQGPAHVVAAEAQLRQPAGEATFKGQARLWQQANSVAAPVIVLDRTRQTLTARSADPAEPVRAVLLSTGTSGKSATPAVIRVRGGDLKYSDAERKAVMHGGALGTVVAETGTATSVSNEVDLQLLPAGNHAARDGGQAQVDRMTARGHVVITSEGRRGTGEQLVYSGETGEYVLTGTATTLPRMTDPVRGSVTGEALIFHSRDDSVSIEGGGRKTTTETTAPR
jgi:lipopolysaccharide export system protein LptA